jgi:hypothetical protein
MHGVSSLPFSELGRSLRRCEGTGPRVAFRLSISRSGKPRKDASWGSPADRTCCADGKQTDGLDRSSGGRQRERRCGRRGGEGCRQGWAMGGARLSATRDLRLFRPCAIPLAYGDPGGPGQSGGRVQVHAGLFQPLPGFPHPGSCGPCSAQWLAARRRIQDHGAPGEIRRAAADGCPRGRRFLRRQTTGGDPTDCD